MTLGIGKRIDMNFTTGPRLWYRPHDERTARYAYAAVLVRITRKLGRDDGGDAGSYPTHITKQRLPTAPNETHGNCILHILGWRAWSLGVSHTTRLVTK